jgi:hypothetical protein
MTNDWGQIQFTLGPGEITCTVKFGIDFLILSDTVLRVPYESHNEQDNINLLKTKLRQLYLKTQFLPRSKHFSSRL